MIEHEVSGGAWQEKIEALAESLGALGIESAMDFGSPSDPAIPHGAVALNIPIGAFFILRVVVTRRNKQTVCQYGISTTIELKLQEETKPLPTLTVEDAKAQRVCRLCQKGPQSGSGLPFRFDFGAEHAHDACLVDEGRRFRKIAEEREESLVLLVTRLGDAESVIRKLRDRLDCCGKRRAQLAEECKSLESNADRLRAEIHSLREHDDVRRADSAICSRLFKYLKDLPGVLPDRNAKPSMLEDMVGQALRNRVVCHQGTTIPPLAGNSATEDLREQINENRTLRELLEQARPRQETAIRILESMTSETTLVGIGRLVQAALAELYAMELWKNR